MKAWRRTAPYLDRAELGIAFQGLGRGVTLGSLVLLQAILRAAGKAFTRSNSRPTAAPAPAPAPEKQKPDKGEDKSGEKPEAKKEAKTAPKPPPKASPLEKGAIVLLTCAVLLAPVLALLSALVSLAAPYAPLISAVVITSWVIAACVAAPPKEPETTPNDHEKSAGEQPTEYEHRPLPEDDVHEAARWLRRLVVQHVIEAARHGRRGVHLATICEELPDAWTVTVLRERLEYLDIPTRKLNIRGVANTWGVPRDGLETALGMPLPQALAALAPAPAERPAEHLVEGPAPASPAPLPAAPADATRAPLRER
ncbi:hypothetical protein OIE71_04665 [Streptomyces sp. NBC_01725]|uniref:hypothetical protein n=1 Tax=Streptomyces sp. NBC_01725 TaxID=2975923 RepID=UPI002E2BF4C2|nr:hypothetical protein [Streptomyces sp. NBC_01725]